MSLTTPTMKKSRRSPSSEPSKGTTAAQPSGPVQHKAMGYDDQRATLVPGAQGYEEQRQALSSIQMRGGGSPAGGIHAAAAQGTAGGGCPLPFLSQIQASFGAHDVSQVRAYTGGSAADACQSMGALAYATGNKVAFGGSPDLHTAAHEAAHIVQQRAGVSLKGGVGQSGDRYEQHADAVADLVVQGKSAEGVLSAMVGGAASGHSGRVQCKKKIVMPALRFVSNTKTGQSASYDGRTGTIAADTGYTVDAADKATTKSLIETHIPSADTSWKRLNTINYDTKHSNRLMQTTYPQKITRAKRKAKKLKGGWTSVAVQTGNYWDNAALIYQRAASRVAGDVVKTSTLSAHFNGWVTTANLTHPSWRRAVHLGNDLGCYNEDTGELDAPTLNESEVKLARTAYKKGQLTAPTTTNTVTTRLHDFNHAVGQLTVAHHQMRKFWAAERISKVKAEGSKSVTRQAEITKAIATWGKIGGTIDTSVSLMTGFTAGTDPLTSWRDTLMGKPDDTSGIPGIKVTDAGVEVVDLHRARATLNKLATGGVASKVLSGIASLYYDKELKKCEDAITKMNASTAILGHLSAFSWDESIKENFKSVSKALRTAVRKLDLAIKNRREQFKTFGNQLDAFARNKKNRKDVKASGTLPVASRKEVYTPKFMLMHAIREAHVFASQASSGVDALRAEARSVSSYVRESRNSDRNSSIYKKPSHSMGAAQGIHRQMPGEKAVIDSVNSQTGSFLKYWKPKLPNLQKYEKDIQGQLGKISGNLKGENAKV